ncbi:hypothetical protein [Dasineura jujubifolia toursvirus 2a]|nr:hypothetical protein [Dasineura jujubifolia toursvirus 2a]
MKGKEINIIKVPLPESVFIKPDVNFEPFNELYLNLLEDRKKVKHRKRSEMFNYESFHKKLKRREEALNNIDSQKIELFNSPPPIPQTPSSVYSKVSSRPKKESRKITKDVYINKALENKKKYTITEEKEIESFSNKSHSCKSTPRSSILGFSFLRSPRNLNFFDNENINECQNENTNIKDTTNNDNNSNVIHLKDLKDPKTAREFKLPVPVVDNENQKNTNIENNYVKRDPIENKHENKHENANDENINENENVDDNNSETSSVRSYFSEENNIIRNEGPHIVKTVLSSKHSIGSSTNSINGTHVPDSFKSSIVADTPKNNPFSIISAKRKHNRINSFRSDIVGSAVHSVRSVESVSEDDEKRELLFKFQLLSSKNPALVAKYPFNMRSDIRVMRNTYTMILKQISVNNKVDNMNTYLLAGFMGCEYLFGKMGFDMEGFSKHQISSMKSYEALLVELGEKEYTPYGMDKWSVEVRLMATLVFNAFWFIVAKSISNKTNFDLLGMLGKNKEQVSSNLQTQNDPIGSVDSPPITLPKPPSHDNKYTIISTPRSA